MKRTLERQAQLPQLPLPALEDTCRLYLETVRPFLSAGDLEKTERGARVFFYYCLSAR